MITQRHSKTPPSPRLGQISNYYNLLHIIYQPGLACCTWAKLMFRGKHKYGLVRPIWPQNLAEEKLVPTQTQNTPMPWTHHNSTLSGCSWVIIHTTKKGCDKECEKICHVLLKRVCVYVFKLHLYTYINLSYWFISN